MSLRNPITNPPNDGERILYKVTGDPKIEGLEEPTTGRFKAPNPESKLAERLVGIITDDKTGNTLMIWKDQETDVAGWQPHDEYLSLLH